MESLASLESVSPLRRGKVRVVLTPWRIVRRIQLVSLAVGVAAAGCNLGDPVDPPPVQIDVGDAGSRQKSDVCVPESDEEACRRLDVECGTVTNNCGETADCGACPTDEFCEDDRCIECRTDADCDADACEECDEGVCVTTCTRECETCDGSGTCIDSDGLCDADACETCTTGFCTSTCSGCLTCQSGACRADESRCRDDETCCESSGRCRTDDSPVTCPE